LTGKHPPDAVSLTGEIRCLVLHAKVNRNDLFIDSHAFQPAYQTSGILYSKFYLLSANKKGLRINAALGRKLTNFLAGGIYYTKSCCTGVDLKADIQALLLRRVTTPNMVRPRPSSIRAFGSGTDAVLAENVRIREGVPTSCADKDQTAAVSDKVLVRSEK